MVDYVLGKITDSAGYGAKTQGQTLAELPLYDLFAAPFQAAARVQANLAEATSGFIRQFAMDACGNVFMTTLSTFFDIPISSVSDLSGNYLVDPSGGGLFASSSGITTSNSVYDGAPGGTGSGWGTVSDGGKVIGYCTAKLVAADYAPGTTGGYQKKIANRVYSMDSKGKVLFVQGIKSVSVPFISLVNVPALTLEEVTVEFCINIKTQEVKERTDDAAATSVQASQNQGRIGVKGWFGGFNYARQSSAVSTAVATSKSKATSDTSTESTYLVTMKAKQVDPPGLTAILKFITNNKDIASQKTVDSTGKIIDNGSGLAFGNGGRPASSS
uniref:Uncharacterized protein n=1 Tax=viral metagenome TaxID=1070528 RepID=A0A6C0E5F8_9ZZZZ